MTGLASRIQARETGIDEPGSARTDRLAVLLGMVHFLVDAATVTVVMRAVPLYEVDPAIRFAVIVGYDFIAFGSQPIFGWLIDRLGTPKRGMLLGLLLTAASVVAVHINPAATMALAGIGNALFHLGGGAAVLRQGLARATPAGFFVAPGALGLGFGMYYGTHPAVGPAWIVGLPVLAALVAVSLMRSPGAINRNADLQQPSPVMVILLLLLVSVAIRSLVGLSAANGCPRTTLLIAGIPIAGFLGKSIGGILADRFGWIATSVPALLLSAPFIAWCAGYHLLLLMGLFLFQMTMPVTLTAVARTMPKYPATAFGLTCLALIIGAAFTMFPFGVPFCFRRMLVLWILVSAVALFFGLRLLPATTTKPSNGHVR